MHTAQGERRGPHSRPYEHDMWLYKAPVPSTEPLHIRIDELWGVFKSRKHDLLQLRRNSQWTLS